MKFAALRTFGRQNLLSIEASLTEVNSTEMLRHGRVDSENGSLVTCFVHGREMHSITWLGWEDFRS